MMTHWDILLFVWDSQKYFVVKKRLLLVASETENMGLWSDTQPENNYNNCFMHHLQNILLCKMRCFWKDFQHSLSKTCIFLYFLVWKSIQSIKIAFFSVINSISCIAFSTSKIAFHRFKTVFSESKIASESISGFYNYLNTYVLWNKNRNPAQCGSRYWLM